MRVWSSAGSLAAVDWLLAPLGRRLRLDAGGATAAVEAPPAGGRLVRLVPLLKVAQQSAAQLCDLFFVSVARSGQAVGPAVPVTVELGPPTRLEGFFRGVCGAAGLRPRTEPPDQLRESSTSTPPSGRTGRAAHAGSRRSTSSGTRRTIPRAISSKAAAISAAGPGRSPACAPRWRRRWRRPRCRTACSAPDPIQREGSDTGPRRTRQGWQSGWPPRRRRRRQPRHSSLRMRDLAGGPGTSTVRRATAATPSAARTAAARRACSTCCRGACACAVLSAVSRPASRTARSTAPDVRGA